jgi:hypothetical protein
MSRYWDDKGDQAHKYLFKADSSFPRFLEGVRRWLQLFLVYLSSHHQCCSRHLLVIYLRRDSPADFTAMNVIRNSIRSFAIMKAGIWS